MASVTLERITKKWGDVVGVDDVSLDIADEEFLVLLGPSGCGKTTTMRMVAGLEEPTAGRLMIGERVVNRLEPKDRDVAMVVQSYALYPQMSVYENIRFPLTVRNVPKAEQDGRVRRAASMVELTPLLDRYPRELSGGQRQRVALARAVVREPKVFLMDEPLSNLDAKLRVSMRAQLKHLQHELSATTIYVTHDQIEAMTLADRVAVMEKGRVRQLGTPADIYDEPENLFVAGFIGSPPMNLVDGLVEGGMFKGPGVLMPGFGAISYDPAVLGVRAEDLNVAPPDKANIVAPIYSAEMTGDATMITVRLGDDFVTAKADKAVRVTSGETIGFTVAPGRCLLFDRRTQDRVRGPGNGAALPNRAGMQ